MLHPLLRLASRQPQLLADHLQAYSALVASEMGLAATQFKRDLGLRVLGYGAAAAAALLGAIALMLWAVVPVASMNQPWVLVAVPLLPAALACWALSRAKTSETAPAFAHLKRQWAADAALLREASGP